MDTETIHRLTDLLASHVSPSDAAALLNITSQAVYKQLQNGQFRAVLAEKQSVFARDNLKLLEDEIPNNINLFRRLRDDGTVAHKIRIEAANALDNLMWKLREVSINTPRIAALEAGISE